MAEKKMEETFGGYILHNVPFPEQLDEEALKSLKAMGPILIEQPYSSHIEGQRAFQLDQYRVENVLEVCFRRKQACHFP